MKIRRLSAWLKASAMALAVLTAGVGSSDAQSKLSVERLVEFFEIVAFGSEIEGVITAPFVRKWKPESTLLFKMGGNSKSVKTFRPVIQKHAKALGFDTGLKFLEIGPKDPGEHFIFWFAEPDKMVEAGLMIEKNASAVRKVAQNARCFFLAYNLGDGQYIKSMIVINRANKFTDIEHCLLEEMAQSLGLPNDDPLVSPSIFNDREHHLELTRVDRFLLRTLYDKRLPAGTPKEAAMKLVASIMTDLGKRSGWAE